MTGTMAASTSSSSSALPSSGWVLSAGSRRKGTCWSPLPRGRRQAQPPDPHRRRGRAALPLAGGSGARSARGCRRAAAAALAAGPGTPASPGSSLLSPLPLQPCTYLAWQPGRPWPAGRAPPSGGSTSSPPRPAGTAGPRGAGSGTQRPCPGHSRPRSLQGTVTVTSNSCSTHPPDPGAMQPSLLPLHQWDSQHSPGLLAPLPSPLSPSHHW